EASKCTRSDIELASSGLEIAPSALELEARSPARAPAITRKEGRAGRVRPRDVVAPSPLNPGFARPAYQQGRIKSALKLRIPLYFAAKYSILGTTSRPVGGSIPAPRRFPQKTKARTRHYGQSQTHHAQELRRGNGGEA